MLIIPFAAFPWDSVISGTAGLINGIFNSAATGRANKRNIQFAKESQAEQERFAKEMFNMENEYNSPEAVMQRLASAGINPNAYWSQSSGTAGMASGDSSVSPVTPNIQPIPSPIQGLVGSSPFESIMKLKEIRKIESETKRQDIENQSLGDFYASQIEKNEASAALDRSQKSLNDLNVKWFDKSKKTELWRLSNEAYYFAQAGKNQKSQAALNKVKKRFEEWNLDEYLPKYLQELEASIALIGEQKRTEISKQKNLATGSVANLAGAASSYSDAALKKAKTLTEDELRPHVVEAQKIENRISGYRATQEKAKAKYIDKQLATDLELAIKNSLLLEGQKELLLQRIRYAEKENDWYEFNQVINAFSSVTSALSGFAPTKTSQSSSIRHTNNGLEKNVTTRTSRLP